MFAVGREGEFVHCGQEGRAFFRYERPPFLV